MRSPPSYSREIGYELDTQRAAGSRMAQAQCPSASCTGPRAPASGPRGRRLNSSGSLGPPSTDAGALARSARQVRERSHARATISVTAARRGVGSTRAGRTARRAMHYPRRRTRRRRVARSLLDLGQDGVDLAPDSALSRSPSVERGVASRRRPAQTARPGSGSVHAVSTASPAAGPGRVDDRLSVGGSRDRDGRERPGRRAQAVSAAREQSVQCLREARLRRTTAAVLCAPIASSAGSVRAGSGRRARAHARRDTAARGVLLLAGVIGERRHLSAVEHAMRLRFGWIQPSISQHRSSRAPTRRATRSLTPRLSGVRQRRCPSTVRAASPKRRRGSTRRRATRTSTS